jgi:hypothetical protein
MNKFLNIYDLSRLNQEDIKKLNPSIVSNEIKRLVVYQETKSQDWMDSLLNSASLLKKN